MNVPLLTATAILLGLTLPPHTVLAGPETNTKQAAQSAQAAPYQAQADWPATTVRDRLGICSSIAVNSKNEVHIFHRANRTWTTPFPPEPIAEPTIVVIDHASGKLLRTMGSNFFAMPHGIFIDREDNLWVTDVALHQVVKLSPTGEPLLLLGESRKPGADPQHFNMPTDVAQLADGSILVSDGYKNARVIRFNQSGRYLGEWGRPGKGPGEFRLPHAIATNSQDHVFVCDRTNARVQVLNAEGGFLRQWDLTSTGTPYGMTLLPNGNAAIVSQDPQMPNGPHITFVSPDGSVLSQMAMTGSSAGELRGGHDIACAKDGSLYVAEIGNRRIQKFSPTPSTPEPSHPPKKTPATKPQKTPSQKTK